jgi:hypothetical protein
MFPVSFDCFPYTCVRATHVRFSLGNMWPYPRGHMVWYISSINLWLHGFNLNEDG